MAVYLLKYNRPAGDATRLRASARRYLGYANDHRVWERIEEHRSGNWFELRLPDKEPPALPKWFHENGIGFEVERVIMGGTRKLERRLKKAGHFERIPSRVYRCELPYLNPLKGWDVDIDSLPF